MGPTTTPETPTAPAAAVTTPDTQPNPSIAPIETQIPPLTPDLGGQQISSVEAAQTAQSSIGITPTAEAAADNPALNSTITPLPGSTPEAAPAAASSLGAETNSAQVAAPTKKWWQIWKV